MQKPTLARRFCHLVKFCLVFILLCFTQYVNGQCPEESYYDVFITPSHSGPYYAGQPLQLQVDVSNGPVTDWSTYIEYYDENYNLLGSAANSTSPVSFSFEINPEATPIYVRFFTSAGCKSLYIPFEVEVSNPIEFNPVYARACGDGIARIEFEVQGGMTSTMYFQIYKNFNPIAASSPGSAYVEVPSYDPLSNYFAQLVDPSVSYVSNYQFLNVDMPPSAPAITGVDAFCNSSPTTFTAYSPGSNGQYHWKLNGTDYYNNGNFQIPSGLSPGVYVLEVRSQSWGGCYSSWASKAVTASSGAVSSTIAANATNIYNGQAVTISSSGGTAGTVYYRCSNDGGNTWTVFNEGFEGRQSFEHTPPAAGTYLYQVHNATNGTCGTSAYSGGVTVAVNELPVNPPPTVTLATPVPSGDRNFIFTRTLTKANVISQADINALTPADYRAEIQYLDGLGRPLQNIAIQASPDGRDIVTPFAYDIMGRQEKSYLSYAVVNTPGAFRSNALNTTYSSSEQYLFYQNAGHLIPRMNNPFTQTIFESVLNRPVEVGAPGTSWAMGNGHTAVNSYDANVANEVRKWNIFGQGQSVESAGGSMLANASYSNHTPGTTEYKATQSITFTDGFSSRGESFVAHIVSGGSGIGNSNMGAGSTSYYGAGQLYKTVFKDEQQNTVIEYKDKAGKVICKKVQDGIAGTTPTYLTTQYVYDSWGGLVYVIPPALDNLTGFTEADDNFLNYIYGYHYDGKKRLIEKKIPGKGWEYSVYNSLDLPVFTSDAEQRQRGVWSYNKYDNLGRTVITGEVTEGSSRVDLQNQVSSQLKPLGSMQLWESYDNTQPWGYTNNTLPQSNTRVFTVNYYDDYDILNTALNPYNSLFTQPNGTTETTATKSLPTVTLVNILGTGNYLMAATYYDDKGRVKKTIKQHQLNGVDVINNSYNFAGELLTASRQHYNNNNLNTPALTVSNTAEYDHAGRNKSNLEQINQQSPVSTTLTYNALGQLEAKAFGGQTNSYIYNSRGWLKRSRSALFSIDLKYDDASHNAQYSGNIAQQHWGTAANPTLHYYNYSYDKANRLTGGISDEGYNETGIGYDKMGNIQTLTRAGANLTGVGTLSYNYNGNGHKLHSVTGGYNKTYSYNHPNGNMTGDGQITIQYNELDLPMQINGAPGGTIAYTYDAAGSKLIKQSASETRYYAGGIEYYTNSVVTTPQIDIIHIGGGVIRNNNGTFSYEYFLADHLGNTRVVHNGAGGILQQQDYLPFGQEIARQNNTPNRYLYNGKEKQEELGQYDYGARFYDPVIGRWHVVDPLADQMRRHSPYNYAFDNPMRFIDPDGMAPMENDDWYARTDPRTGKTTYAWKEGSETIDGATNLGASLSVSTVGKESGTVYDSYNLNADGSITNNTSGESTTGRVTTEGGSSILGARAAQPVYFDISANPLVGLLTRNPVTIGSFIATVKNLGTTFKSAVTAAEVAGAEASVAAKTSTSGGEFLFNTWHKGTFANRTQSVMYHVGKHGNGRTAVQYTQDAMSFFNKNKGLGQNMILKDGTRGIKIQTKQIINGKTQRVGGWWTNDGKLVTFWD